MKRTWTVSLVVAFVALVLFCVPAAWGQATTSLRGAVNDPSGAAIPNATVHLANADTGFARTAATDAQGNYEFNAVLPGTYTVTVEASGFSRYEQKNVQLLVNLPATLNIKMKIGATSQTVTVTEQAPLINTTDASQGNTMSGNEIGNLPLEGRNVTQLLTLQPGVVFTSDRSDMLGNDTRSGAVNGSRSDQNNLTLDGVDVNDQGSGAPFTTVLPVTVDSVEEFRVTTSDYGADQGRSSGAESALVTRGGTNQFHGDVFEFNRSSFGEANDFFLKTSEAASGAPNKPLQLVRNIYGASLGGPVKHDRLFFFLNYEGHRQAEAASTLLSIPSPSLANGIIQYTCQLNSAGVPVDSRCTQGPNGGGPTVTGADGNPFTPGPNTWALAPTDIQNMDPVINPATSKGFGPSASSLAYFQSYLTNPAVLAGDGNDITGGDGLNLNFDGFRFGAPQHIRNNIAIGRIDYKLTANGNHTLFWRGSGQDAFTPGIPFLPGGPPASSNTNFSKGMVAGYTAVLRPTLVNNFRFGYTRQSIVNGGDCNLPLNGVRNLSQDCNYGDRFSFPVSNITDDLAWTRGKHTFSFGTNIELVYNASSSTFSSFSSGSTNAAWLNVGGFANRASPFNPASAGFPAVDGGFETGYDFPLIGLLGMVTEVNAQYNNHVNSSGVGTPLAQGAPVQRNFALHESELYLQDSFKIKSNLTFNYGLRYEGITAPWETNGQQDAPTFDLASWFTERNAGMMAGTPNNQFPAITFDIAGRSNHRADWWPTGHNFAPRLSVAWSPEPSWDWAKKLVGTGDKTVIRAGFGQYYDHYGQGMILTFDRSGGEFGLATNLSNPAQVETAASSPRWQPISGQGLISAINNIPNKDPITGNPILDPQGNPIFTPAPAATFPVTFPAGNFCICWGIDSSLKTPYSYSLDFSVARQLPHNMSVEVAYISHLGHRLLVQSDLAQPLNLRDTASGFTYYQAATAMANLARVNGGGGTDPSTVTSATIGLSGAYWNDLFTPIPKNSSGQFTDQYNVGALISNNVANQQCGLNPASSTGAGWQLSPTTDPVQAIYQTYLCTANNETSGLDFFDVAGIPSLNGNPSYFAKTGQYTWFDSQFSSLFAWRTQSFSRYQGLEITFQKQMSQGLSFNVNYTYSTSFDLASDGESVGEWSGLSGEVVNPWMGNQLSGPSDFDLRHQINGHWVWQLPFGQGRPFASHVGKALDALVGGWQLSGITRWSSGFPISGGTCFCFPTNWQLTGLASATNRLSGGHSNVTDPAGSLTYNIFKNPATAFNDLGVPLPGQSGSRNPFRGDGFLGTNMQFGKTWKMPFNESHSLKLTADMFNVMNTKRFDVQSLSLSTGNQGSFGDYSRLLTNPRIMQFGLAYIF